MTNEKNITVLRNDGSLLSGLQHYALASQVHFAHNKANQGCKCIALQATPRKEEAAIILQQGTFLVFCHPCLVSIRFTRPSQTLNEVLSKTFSLVFVRFRRVSIPNFKHNSFHLNHISGESAYRQRQDSYCYSSPNMISHYRQCVHRYQTVSLYYLPPNTILSCKLTYLSPATTFCAGDEHCKYCR